MNNIFELVSNNNTQVVIKVNAKDPFTVAMNPYVSGDMEYITVTKGYDHVMTVIKSDCSKWSIDWGSRGHTLIGPSTERLKMEVLKFINELNISIEYRNQPVKQVNVYFNDFIRKWEVSITPEYGPHIAHFSEKAKCLEDIMAEAEAIIPRKCKRWEPYTSPTTGHKSHTMIFE